MTTSEAIKTLRQGGSLNMFDSVDRLFIKIQLNRKAEFVCWQRFAAKRRGEWTIWNEYLSLKDVLNIRHELAIKRTKQLAA